MQNRAKASHAAISDSCTNLFKVVGSTAAANARVNTDTEASDTDAAVYWLKEVKMADDYADFYDGSWDNTNSNGKLHKNEYGGQRTISILNDVWTGSNASGEQIYLNDQRMSLDSSFVAYDDLDRPYPLATLSSGKPQGARYTIYNRYYGLSPVFIAGHVVTISADAPRVTEGESVSFTVRADPVPSRPIEVTLDVRDSGDFARRGQTGIKRLTLSAGAAAANS